MAPVGTQYQYRVRLVPDGRETVDIDDPGDGGWELVSTRVTTQGDALSVFRRDIAHAPAAPRDVRSA